MVIYGGSDEGLTLVQGFGDFILKRSSAYIHPRPTDFPAHLKWPQRSQIVDSLARMATLSWPYVQLTPPAERCEMNRWPANVTSI